MFTLNGYDIIYLLALYSSMSLGLILVVWAWIRTLSTRRTDGQFPLMSLFVLTPALLVNLIQFFVRFSDPFFEFHVTVDVSSFSFLLGIVCVLCFHLSKSRDRILVGVGSYFFLLTGFCQLIGTTRGNTAKYYGW